MSPGRVLPIVVLAIALLTSTGCAKSPVPAGPGPAMTTPSSAVTSTAETATRAYAQATPPATPGPEALTLPAIGGRAVQDPALLAKSPRDLLKPGATVALTPAALRLMGASVEGTMVATILSKDAVRRQLIVRVARFRGEHSTGIYDPPTKLVIPKGTLVRVQIPKPAKGATTIKATDLVVGDTVALVVRIGTKPQGPYVDLLAVVPEGGAGK